MFSTYRELFDGKLIRADNWVEYVVKAVLRARHIINCGAECPKEQVKQHMSLTFETLGNATVQFKVDGRPIFATDPWLRGTCYFGSWALDHSLTPEEIQNVQQSPYIWISHGHPDHLHPESLRINPARNETSDT